MITENSELDRLSNSNSKLRISYYNLQAEVLEI